MPLPVVRVPVRVQTLIENGNRLSLAGRGLKSRTAIMGTLTTWSKHFAQTVNVASRQTKLHHTLGPALWRHKAAMVTAGLHAPNHCHRFVTKLRRRCWLLWELLARPS